MCFWKRKKKEVITGNLYNLGQRVTFKRREDLMIGYIYEIHKDEEGKIIYDVQVGGECPTIIKGIAEDKIHVSRGR